MYFQLISLLLFLTVAGTGNGQAINGCPSFGCNPMGTFSYKLTVPMNASVGWKSDFFIGPLPEGLGCVGNSNNLVCQFNSPRDVGYVSIDVLTGKLQWKDAVLRFPTLPIMDIYGDIIGSDGNNLVKYETNGQLDKPIIHLGSYIHPIYSLMVTDNNMVLIVSQNGGIYSYQTNGIPDAAIWLNGTVERSNGTFIPVSQPIIAHNRVYILTQFKPDDPTSAKPSVLGMQRLYAIDCFDRMIDRLHITWFMNFEKEVPFERDFIELQKTNGHVSFFQKENDNKQKGLDSETLKFIPRRLYKRQASQPTTAKSFVMYQSEQSMVYVYLSPPEADSNALPMLWGMKDAGDNSNLLFKVPLLLSSLATYRSNSDNHKQGQTNLKERSDKMALDGGHASETPLWGVDGNGESVVKLSPESGSILKSINMSTLLKTPAKAVSNIMVARDSDAGSDILITGVTVSSKKDTKFLELCRQSNTSTDNTNYVIAFNENDLLWMVATPNNTQVIGQIAGIPKPNPFGEPKAQDDSRDELAVFAGTSEFSLVFSIH